MAEPCKQEEIIGELKATTKFFKEFMERHEEREERMVGYMAVVAAQSETLKAHADLIAKQERGLSDAFKLIRRQKNFAIRVMESEAGIYVLAVVALGLIVDIVAHYSIVKQIWVAIKG